MNGIIGEEISFHCSTLKLVGGIFHWFWSLKISFISHPYTIVTFVLIFLVLQTEDESQITPSTTLHSFPPRPRLLINAVSSPIDQLKEQRDCFSRLRLSRLVSVRCCPSFFAERTHLRIEPLKNDLAIDQHHLHASRDLRHPSPHPLHEQFALPRPPSHLPVNTVWCSSIDADQCRSYSLLVIDQCTPFSSPIFFDTPAATEDQTVAKLCLEMMFIEKKKRTTA